MITLTLTPSPSSTFFRLAFNVHFCAVKIYFYFHFTLAKLFNFLARDSFATEPAAQHHEKAN